jgi:hypothetical protein
VFGTEYPSSLGYFLTSILYWSILITASRHITALANEDEPMADTVTRREVVSKLAATTGIGALLVAATAEARGAEGFHHEGRGDAVHVEWGIVNKPNVGALTVTFKNKFADPPVVLLTPYWDGQGAEVGHVETLEKVTHSEFKLVSDNAAENYYVSWVAIGRRK